MIEAVIAGNVSSEDPMFGAYVMSMLVCDTVDALESSRHEDVNWESGYVACHEIRSRQSDLHPSITKHYLPPVFPPTPGRRSKNMTTEVHRKHSNLGLIGVNH